MRARGALAGLLALAAGCVAYHPAPVDRSVAPASYAARTLDDAGVRAWVDSLAGPIADQAPWTDAQLVVAALGLRPELDVARAELRTSRAGLVTAGQRPQPGLATDLERRVSGVDQGGPWVVTLAPQLIVELGGKRAARRELAFARVAEQEFALREQAYGVVAEVRTVAADLRGTTAQLAALDSARTALASALAALERRVDAGSAGTTDLARARADVQGVAVEVAAARRVVQERQAALAAALGVPVPAVRELQLSGDPRVGCDWLRRAGVRGGDSVALEHRYPVGGALAAYAVADAALKLEVARQYPDLQLGPGFTFDQATNRFVLGLGLPTVSFNRNRGPIGEASALRERAAAVVATAQEQVLATVSAARAGCDRAATEAAAADSLIGAADSTLALMERAYDRGERGALDVVLARVGRARAAITRTESVGRLRRADVDAELSAGVWLDGAPRRWPDPATPSPLRPVLITP